MSRTHQLKRLFVLVGSLALFALTAAASAAGPTHFQFSDSGTDFAPAGELCDFDYTASFAVQANVVLFGDPDNPTKIIDYVSLAKTHTNADTGYSLSEVDHFAEQVNASAERVKQVGVFWHLRDSSGKLVVVQAGQIMVDTSTGEIVKVTPNFNPDFAAVICPALGGSPAI